MASKPRKFEEGGIYHIYNRGVEKRITFIDDRDYKRFLNQLAYYQQRDRTDKYSRIKFKISDRDEPLLFDVICYCLMPNHFHLLARARDSKGISEGLSRFINAYTKAFNTRHNRVGSLFQGSFKSVKVNSEAQLLQVYRYILLNPFVAQLVDDPQNYSWSSVQEFYREAQPKICDLNTIKDIFRDKESIMKFITDYNDYAARIHMSRKQLIDIES